MPKNAIVIGAPRSGTSLAASIFAGAGYYVADETSDELRPGDEHNPTGYWEAETLVRRNAELFEASGFPFDNTWLYEPINDSHTLAIERVELLPGHDKFLNLYEKNTPWLWKDPRLCYTLGYWWQHLSQKENTAILLVQRDPEDVYRSFIRLKWREPGRGSYEDVMSRLQDHYNHVHKVLERFEIPYMTLSYDRLGSSPQECAEEISGFFQIDRSKLNIEFDERLNRSTLRGRMSVFIDRCSDKLPAAWRRRIKQAIPRPIFNFVFPYRD